MHSTNTLAVTKLAYLESVFAAYFIGYYSALWLQEGHPHWHDGWSHGPVPGQSIRPDEGALTDGGKGSAAGTGAKVTVRGQGEWQSQGRLSSKEIFPYKLIRQSWHFQWFWMQFLKKKNHILGHDPGNESVYFIFLCLAANGVRQGHTHKPLWPAY